MLKMIGIEIATIIKLKPDNKIDNNKVRNDHKKVCNLTRAKPFDKKLREIDFFNSDAKLALSELR